MTNNGGIAIPYSPKERLFIKNNRSLLRRELHTLFCKKFNRDNVTLAHINALAVSKNK